MTVPRRALLLTVVMMVTEQSAGAQAALAQERVCDMSMQSVSLTLVDRAGRPVSNAAILVRRVQRRTLVRGASSLGNGTYTVIEDGAVPDLRAGGEPFDVTFRRDDRIRRVRLIIGMDAARCHVALKGGRSTVRF